MADWNLAQTWADAYSIRGGYPDAPGFGETGLSPLDGDRFAYQVAPDLQYWRRRLNAVPQASFNPAAETLVVGDWWMVEIILQLDPTHPVWATDMSQVVHDSLTLANGVPQRVIDRTAQIDITDPTAVDQFDALGWGNKGQFRNVVTVHACEDQPWADLPAFLDACEALLRPGPSEAFHLVRDFVAAGIPCSGETLTYNQNCARTLAEYVALRPAHWWIDTFPPNAVGGGQ